MMSQSWEVAGKKSKQKSSNSNGTAKSNKAKISPLKPFDTTQTLFEAFNKDNKEVVKDIIKEDESKKKKVVKPSVVKQKPSQMPKSLLDAVTNFEGDELLAIYNNDRDVFPNNSFIWLKDLATYISKKLDVQQIVSFTYSEYPAGFPLKQFSCRKEIHNILKECSSEASQSFINDYFDMLIKDANKDSTIQGYKLIVQAILSQYPEIILDNPEKIVRLLKTNQNKPQICLALIWTIGQVGSNSVQTQFVVWCKLMLPFILSPNLAKYIINYVENIFSNADPRKLTGLMDVDEFISIFDYIYSPESLHIREEYRNRLMKIYPNLKAIVFTNKSNLQPYFAILVSKLNEAKQDDKLYDEIMELLITCLKLDNSCYGKWKTMHLKYLSESCLFLRYLNNNWARVSKVNGLDTKFLLKTIESLQTDPKMSNGKASHTLNKKSIDNCNNYIKLLKKRRSSGFLKMFVVNFLLFFTAAIAFLIYDTKRGDPQNSYVVWFYEKADELGYGKHLDQAQLYTDQGLQKIMEILHHGREYYNKSVGPHIQPQLEKWTRFSIEHAQRVGKEMGPYVEQGKELAHVYLIKLHEATNLAYEKVKPYCDRKYLVQIGEYSSMYFDELQKFIKSLVAKNQG